MIEEVLPTSRRSAGRCAALGELRGVAATAAEELLDQRGRIQTRLVGSLVQRDDDHAVLRADADGAGKAGGKAVADGLARAQASSAPPSAVAVTTWTPFASIVL